MRKVKNQFAIDLKFALLIFYGIFLNSGCGIKGDPLPPERPATLGRGQPTFIDAKESLSYPELPPIKRSNEIEEEQENEE